MLCVPLILNSYKKDILFHTSTYKQNVTSVNTRTEYLTGSSHTKQRGVEYRTCYGVSVNYDPEHLITSDHICTEFCSPPNTSFIRHMLNHSVPAEGAAAGRCNTHTCPRVCQAPRTWWWKLRSWLEAEGRGRLRVDWRVESGSSTRKYSLHVLN